MPAGDVDEPGDIVAEILGLLAGERDSDVSPGVDG
jgi:hypothetical protein